MELKTALRREMSALLLALSIFMYLLSGCGYTQLKTSPPQPRKPHTEAFRPPPKSAETFPDISGTWRGVIECVDHGTVRSDSIFLMEFLSDSNWYVESGKTRYTGTWSAVKWESNLTIVLRVPDSPWMWNGSLAVNVYGNEMVPTLSRPWQFDCTMWLRRL